MQTIPTKLIQWHRYLYWMSWVNFLFSTFLILVIDPLRYANFFLKNPEIVFYPQIGLWLGTIFANIVIGGPPFALSLLMVYWGKEKGWNILFSIAFVLLIGANALIAYNNLSLVSMMYTNTTDNFDVPHLPL